MAALVKKYGLESSSLQADTMTTRMRAAQALVPTQKRLEALTKRMGDEIFNAQCDSWEATTNGYARLRRLAKRNGEIATAIAPVQGYFSRRRKAAKEPAAETASMATASTTPPGAPGVAAAATPPA